jgi:plasmid stabilization system protein ParE
MTRAVWLADGAARDLDELYAEAYDRGGSAAADRFLDRMQVSFAHLAEGTVVGQRLPELERLGLDDGRVLRDGDLRLVYRLRESDAVVALIARDGRSMQSLLQRRTLDS